MKSLSILFGQSPFGPIQEHMRTVRAAVGELPELFQATLAGDAAAAVAARDKVATREAEADVLEAQVREHLPRRLFLPVPRADLLAMLALQEAVANKARDIAERMVERSWGAPEAMHGPILGLVRASVAVVHETSQAMEYLDELVEVGFGGPEADAVRARIREVAALRQIDYDARAAARQVLFAHESTLGTLDLMLWLQMFDLLGDLASLSKRVAAQLRVLIAS